MSAEQPNLIFVQLPGDDLPLPNGFRRLDDIVSGHEKDMNKRRGLAEARKRLASRYPGKLSRFTDLRLKQGLSQRELADLVGTSQSHVARIEAGSEDIRLSTLRKLAKVLNTSVGEIAETL